MQDESEELKFQANLAHHCTLQDKKDMINKYQGVALKSFSYQAKGI